MYRTETHSPHAFQEEPLTFQLEGHYSRGNGVHWTGSVCTPLGSHPIKSTVSWVLACQVHCCPTLCSDKPGAQVPALWNSQDAVLRGAAQGATMVIPVCTQDVGRRELKEGPHTYPFLLSIFLFS